MPRSNKRYEKWFCEVIVELNGDERLPDFFDGPPRFAVKAAISKHANIVSCASGWGQEITEKDKRWIRTIKKMGKKRGQK